MPGGNPSGCSVENGGSGGVGEDQQEAHLEILRNVGKMRQDPGRLGGRQQRWTRGLTLAVLRW